MISGAARLASLLAAATADGSTVVAARVLPSTLSAVVVRRTGWMPPSERGAVEIRRWRRGDAEIWFPTRAGLHLDAATVGWLLEVLAADAVARGKGPA